MSIFWRLMGRLNVGRFRDWYRFAYVKLRSRGTIIAADLPYIDPPFKLRMSPHATLKIGRNVHFRPGFSADIEQSGVLEIGNDTAFNVNCWVGVVTRITVGDSCLIGPMATMTDGNHSFDQIGELIRDQGLETREITIGDNVWVGAKATIIHDIGDGAVIGANAVVTKPVPPNAVAVGVPARVVRRRGERGPHEVQDARQA
jgi:acetyltransferase-like isoleucine patch superfamily enzyme